VKLEGALLPNGLWLGTGIAALMYATLFLLPRRPAAIRAGRLALLGLLVLVLRAMLLSAGYTVDTWLDASFLLLGLLGTFILALGRRMWILRTQEADLRKQINWACSRLYLPFNESATGQFLFTIQDNTYGLRVLSFTHRIQFVLLPPIAAHRKVALLVNWLSKQYPEPLPRVHITLKRRKDQ